MAQLHTAARKIHHRWNCLPGNSKGFVQVSRSHSSGHSREKDRQIWMRWLFSAFEHIFHEWLERVQVVVKKPEGYYFFHIHLDAWKQWCIETKLRCIYTPVNISNRRSLDFEMTAHRKKLVSSTARMVIVRSDRVFDLFFFFFLSKSTKRSWKNPRRSYCVRTFLLRRNSSTSARVRWVKQESRFFRD